MTTLARLVCWIDPVQADDFAEACDRRLLHLLERHGLEPLAEVGRPTVPSAHTLLFAADTPAAVVKARDALGEDAVWQDALRALGSTFGTPPSPLRVDLHHYESTAGSGTTTPVGSGSRQNLWHSFTLRDGFPYMIVDLLDDGEGGIWMASEPGIGGGGSVISTDRG